MKETNGTSARRALRVLKALKGHALDGVANKELAEALDESPANISRALDALESEGFARKLDNGRWAHSKTMLQIAVAYYNETDTAQARLAELRQCVAAGARG